MVEYVIADSDVSQVFAQHGGDPAALWRRDRFVLLKLVLVIAFCSVVRSFANISSTSAR